MTVGTRTDSTSGVVTTDNSSGFSVERNTSNVGFAPYKVDSIYAVTSSLTLAAGDAGVITLSSSVAGVLTEVMPTAASTPGATFIFRTTSAHAHILTGSQEANGTKVFINRLTGSGVTSDQQGSRLTLNAAQGSSVFLQSDGRLFHVLAYSGSFTIAGT
ncbi:MAG: hypothetical protein EBU90_24620 [Proteobacteria bacterium]|nr:hypothetical protein [Pseudomonadota bacterium]